jgi:two-component system chemotaxis response regulator CheB
MHDRGAATIAQDEETCTVFGMPKAAIELAAVDRVLPINDVGPAIAELVG